LIIAKYIITVLVAYTQVWPGMESQDIFITLH